MYTTLFSDCLDELMYRFEIRLMLQDKFGRDLGGLILSFLKRDPVPYLWYVEVPPSPWDALISVDTSAMVNLPLFAP